MVMSMQTSLLAAALLVAGVACQDTAQEPVFMYPPDGSKYTFHRMDTVIVNYTVFHDTAELSTFCDPDHATLIHWQTVPGPSDSIPILLNFVSDERCWFDLRAGPDGTISKSSASFRVLRDERSKGPQTFGVDTDPPTSSTPSATSPTSPPSSTATSTETPSPLPEGGGGGGLKGGALYAVSFCSGIGGAILIFLGLRLWFKWEDWRVERQRKVALAEAHERINQTRERRENQQRTIAEIRARLDEIRGVSGNGNDHSIGGNKGSGGQGIGSDEDAAPRLDVDVFEWRRPGGGSGTAEGGARGEGRDEPDGVAGAGDRVTK